MDKFNDTIWDTEKLGELVEKVSLPVKVRAEATYQEIGIRSHCKGIFHKDKVTGNTLGNKRVFWVEPDCFVVNIVFAWEHAIAKTTKFENGMIASHRFPMYKPKKILLNLDYLYYYLSTPRGKYLLNLASPGGAGRNKTLGQAAFLELSIPTPSVLEQEKIVSILSVWNEIIKSQKKLTSAKKELYKSTLYKLIDSSLKTWEIHRLGNLGKTYGGLSGKSKEDFGKGSPYVSYMEIFSKPGIMAEELAEKVIVSRNETQNEVKRGDIFFTTSSETPEEICYSSVLLNNPNEITYLNSFCFGYRFNNTNVLCPEFAQYLFRTQYFRKKVHKLAQGSTRFNISKKEVMKLDLAIPPIEYQENVVRILEHLFASVKAHEKKLELLKLQKKGLMQVLLTGKVRVNA